MKKIVILSLCLLFFGIYWEITSNTNNKTAISSISVKTIKIKPHQFYLTYQTIGTVKPKQEAELRPQVDGILTEVLFKEGEKVQQGQILAKIDSRIFEAELDKAKADLAADKVKLTEIGNNLQRFEKLSQNSIVSQKALEEQQSLYKQQAAQVEKDKEQVMLQKINLEYAEIKAPFNGKVGLRQIDVGNFVRAAEEKVLTTVVQNNPIVISFSVPQELLPYIKQNKKLQVQAIDRTNDEILAQGEVIAADNKIDTQSGTLELKAEFANDNDVLWSGEFIKINLIYGVLDKAIVLPNEVVRPSLNGNMVYKVQNGKIKIEQVKTEYKNDIETVIVSGVAENDEIVCEGFYQLTNGSAVETEQTNE